MMRICPFPYAWEPAYQKLVKFAETHGLEIPLRPLVLSLWWVSDDIDKEERWKYHKKWAVDNMCQELLKGIPDKDFYFAFLRHKNISRPRLFPPYTNEPKIRPFDPDLKKYLLILKENWEDIIGSDTTKIIVKPLYFSGKKRRSLWVLGDAKSIHPWWKWDYFLKTGEYGRYQFTQFRHAICQAISPHTVDHINFKVY